MKITKENVLEETGTIEIVSSNMSRAKTLVTQVETMLEIVIPNSMVPNSEWFDRDQTKFKE